MVAAELDQTHPEAKCLAARLRALAGLLAVSVAAVLAAIPSCNRHGQADPPPARHPLRVLNWSEVQTLDPARISWLTDIRVADLLFDGLTQYDPKTLQPMPCIAQRWESSDAGRTYTFHLRHDARWSNGDPVTARDFVWSWRRILDPDTAADYVYLMFVIRNAQRYSEGLACAAQPPDRQADLKAKGKFLAPIPFDDVGIKALDDHTLRVQLVAALPYFLDLTSFITFKAVHPATIEKFTIREGDRVVDVDTDWYQKPENLVCNGPYVLDTWVQRQYARFRKRADYYDAAKIPSDVIEILPVEDRGTAFKMYDAGEADLMPFSPPRRLAERLIEMAGAGRRDDIHLSMAFGTYFYRFNTKRKPFDDPRVRIAFARAVDRELLTRKLCWLGEKPALSLVPPGVRRYVSPQMPAFDPGAARKLLAEAGYPGGAGLPVIEIMFNKDQSTHQAMAESIKDMWQRHLGARVELLSTDRGTLRQKMQSLDYFVSRGGWYGDYNDPITFLDMFMTAPEGGGGNNDTGFADPEYDDLITRATCQDDPDRRDHLLARAEEILIVEQMPVLPLYYYAEMYLFRPNLTGFYPNTLGINPLRWVSAAGTRDEGRGASEEGSGFRVQGPGNNRQAVTPGATGSSPASALVAVAEDSPLVPRPSSLVSRPSPLVSQPSSLSTPVPEERP